MSKVEELSRQYAEQQVKDSPDNEYKGYSFELQKELTKFDGYDIEQAYEDGYKQAKEDNALTWEDISIIRKIMYDYNKQVRNEMAIPKEEEYCMEVLKRFLEQKGEEV